MYFSKAALGLCLLLSSSFQEPTASASTASPTQESKCKNCYDGIVPVNAVGKMNPDSWLYQNSLLKKRNITTLCLCHENEELIAPVQLPPDRITMTKDGRREIKYTLYYRVAKYIGPAFTTFLKLFNGVGPAPTIRILPGDNLIIDLVNELEDIKPWVYRVLNEYRDPNITNLHLHGAHIIGINPGDNVSKLVLPGNRTRYNYTFSYDHMPGTMWYHTHWHGATAHQTGQGAAGLLIMEDPQDYPIPNYLKKMTKTHEIEMVLTHLNLVKDPEPYGNNMTDAAEISGSRLTNWTISGTNMDITNFTTAETNMILVNMQYIPHVNMKAGKWYRWRILMASVQERLAMALVGKEGASCTVQLLAKDGIYLTDAPRIVSNIILSAGNRADVAVRCKGVGEVLVKNTGQDFSNNFTTPYDFNTQPIIMRLNIVKRKGQKDRASLKKMDVPRPCYLVNLTSATAPELNPKPLNIGFFFNGSSPDLEPKSLPSINGWSWVDQQTPLQDSPSTIKLGTVQEVVMVTASKHPYHQHVNPFQIMSMSGYQNDATPPAFRNWYQIGDWQDVLQTVDSVPTATVRFAANTFPGPMVMHCHILFHEDRGMITTYNLTGKVTTWPGAKRDVDPSCIPHNIPAGPSGCKYYHENRNCRLAIGCNWEGKSMSCVFDCRRFNKMGFKCKNTKECHWKKNTNRCIPIL